MSGARHKGGAQPNEQMPCPFIVSTAEAFETKSGQANVRLLRVLLMDRLRLGEAYVTRHAFLSRVAGPVSRKDSRLLFLGPKISGYFSIRTASVNLLAAPLRSYFNMRYPSKFLRLKHVLSTSNPSLSFFLNFNEQFLFKNSDQFFTIGSEAKAMTEYPPHLWATMKYCCFGLPSGFLAPYTTITKN